MSARSVLTIDNAERSSSLLYQAIMSTVAGIVVSKYGRYKMIILVGFAIYSVSLPCPSRYFYRMARLNTSDSTDRRRTASTARPIIVDR